jgi:hypothetical protein
MPIARTTWIDDAGTGTTGSIIDNAWLQTLYNQIEAYVTVPPTYGTVALTDISTANLGSLGVGFWMKLDKMVFLHCYIAYPSTASSLSAAIGGLPFVSDSAMHAGLYQCSGAVPSYWYITAATSQIILFNQATGTPRTNVQLSGTGQVVQGFYRVP